MCGTYTLRASSETIVNSFPTQEGFFFPGSYKVAPSTLNPVVICESGKLDTQLYKWGYRPQWMTKDYMKAKKRYPFINARSETLFTTPAFRRAATTSRCLILADGFYEPKGPKGMNNRPYYFFQFPDERLFAFAGITTSYQDDVIGRIDSYAIVTTLANAVVSLVHDRMPVIIHPDDYDLWLNYQADHEDVETLLLPWDGEEIQGWHVSDYVKRREARGSDCIEKFVDL